MIGQRLMTLRKRAGLSQKELGAALAVSHYTISSYEQDRSEPNDDIKVRMARHFGVSLDYLMGLIDDPLPFVREDALFLPESMAASERELLRGFITYWATITETNSKK